LGVREERYAAAQRTLKGAGLIVQPSQISLWSAAGSGPQTQGIVVGRGLVDDGGERHYLVLRSENGRIVYAEFNMTPGQALPDRGAKLSLVPGRSPEIAVVKQTMHGRVR
jgi:hypothetical protein